MGNERGAKNLARFNEQRSANLSSLLEYELRLCKKRKLEFQSHGLLAAYLSDRLKVHRTTLTRNVKYRGMLLAHLAGQPGVVSRTPDSTGDPAILHAKLAASRVEASNLRVRLEHAEAKVAAFQAGVPQASLPDNGTIAFSNLAMVLVNILHRFPDFIQIDRQERSLIDLSAKPSEAIIAGRERLGQFFEWTEQNQSVPMVKALLAAEARK